MDSKERCENELREYRRDLRNGRAIFSATEMARIMEKNGCGKEGEELKKNLNIGG